MCRRVECPTCHRPTFAGCGLHVEQVLGNVPADQRCRCREELSKQPEKTPEKTPEKSGENPGAGLVGRLGALFGRR